MTSSDSMDSIKESSPTQDAPGRPENAPERSSRRRLLDALTILATGLVVLTATFIWSSQETAVVSLDTSPGQSVLFLGDAWLLKPPGPSHSDSLPERVAEEMGWTVTVDGEEGTGYINNGRGLDTRFSDRVKTTDLADAPDILVFQGGGNDAFLDRTTFGANATSTWKVAQKRFPNAAIVIIGPGPTEFPTSDQLIDTDKKLAAAAEKAGLIYISPLDEGWITKHTAAEFLDHDDSAFLSPSGQAAIADLFVTQLRSAVYPD